MTAMSDVPDVALPGSSIQRPSRRRQRVEPVPEDLRRRAYQRHPFGWERKDRRNYAGAVRRLQLENRSSRVAAFFWRRIEAPSATLSGPDLRRSPF